MKPLDLQKHKLVDEINLGLEQRDSLVSVLRKAIRLAKLCQDRESQFLFELHLDGVSQVGGIRVQKWPDNVKPKWNFVEAFREDRAVDNENAQCLSVERMEALMADAKEFRTLATKEQQGEHAANLLKTQYEFQQVLTRIRNRVGNFVVQVEDLLQTNPESEVVEITQANSKQKNVFIGHGRSPLWRDLKDLLVERLKLPWDEFNRESVAGRSNKERLDEMLNNASFAFLIMTAEDEHSDKTLHARENVIHELGLFQGRLGFSKAIVLVEAGCAEFTNIQGLIQIRFPKGDILAKSEEIRRVLEREGILKQSKN